MNPSEDWTVLLQQAKEVNSGGRPSEAISIALSCAERHRSNPDARGWALYHVFNYYLESGDMASAARLADEIFTLNTNLPSKLFVASVSTDYFARIGNTAKVNSTILAIDHCIGKWLERPAGSDDLDITLGLQLVYQAAATTVWDELKNLRFFDPKKDHKTVAFLPAQSFSLVPPRLANAIPDQFRKYLERKPVSEGLSFKSVDGVLLRRCGKFTFAFDQMGSLLPINYNSIPAFYRSTLESLGRNTAGARKGSGVTLSIMDEFNFGLNFCHWLTDYIPRALLAEDRSIQFSNIIGPRAVSTDFQRHSLSGILRNKSYLAMEADRSSYLFENFVYADNFGENIGHPLYGCHPHLIQLLRKDLGQPRGGSVSSPLKLYVPRRGTRRVKNNDELSQYLISERYTCIDTDALSLAEQIELFSAASHVVAPHGAALTNLLFCKPETAVLETFPRWGGSFAFYAISASTGLDYSCYVDLPKGEAPAQSLATFVNEADMHVDLDFVREWIAACR